jgi:DNA-sulfur modification-associated
MEMRKPVTIPIPAVRGHFGQRLYTYQTQLLPSDVATVLGHDPRSDHWKYLSPDLQFRYETVQRTTDKPRRADLMSYISGNIAQHQPVQGAFPAISIGMSQPVSFEPFANESDIGWLKIETSGGNQRLLLDGLARVTAALMLIEQEQKQHNFQGSYTPTQQLFTFPVTIYAPVEGTIIAIEELSQLFYDFNYLQKRISPAHAIALDQSDLYIRLTNHLGNVVLRSFGGMDNRAASLKKKSKAITAQQVLLRFVRGACEGIQFQTSNRAYVDTPNLTRESYAHYAQILESYLISFAEKMGWEKFTNRDAIHLTSPGWQVLGLVFHDLYVRLEASPSTIENVIRRLGEIDWTRYNPDWLLYLGEPECDKGTGEPLSDEQGRPRVKITRLGAGGIKRLRDYVYEKTGLAVLTADLSHEDAA